MKKSDEEEEENLGLDEELIIGPSSFESHLSQLFRGGLYMQYFTVPHPFLQESTGMGLESAGIHRNETGIELESSEMRLENHVYMQIYVYKHLYTNRYN